MGEPATGTVRDVTSRDPRRPARARLSELKTWWRATVAVPTALALAVPLFGLAQTVNPGVAYAEDPVQTCVAGANALPATKSGREAEAARAAAQWFPADQVAMATAIAGAESSWNPTAVNKAARGNYGLWQINSVHKKLLKAKSWREPASNAWMAFQVWDAADGRTGNGKGSWKPWSVYNSGSYREYLRETVPTVNEGPECVSTGGGEVRVATWNVLRSNSKGKIADGTRELTTQSDVFGLQELGSESDRAAAARGADGFTMTTDRTAVPIFYRTDKYTVLAQGRERAYAAGERIERRRGKGTEKTADKWVTWVNLQDKATQESFYVLNTHLLVGAYNKGDNGKKKKRTALYWRQVATVTALADRFQAGGSAVYVTCDCNVNYDADAAPIQMMSDHGLIANWRDLDGSPTLGKRQRYDYVWSNRTPTEQTIGEKSGSDHASVVVTYPPTTGSSGAMTPVHGSARQEINSMRTITDPSSGRTYLVPIPVGRVGTVLTSALDQIGDRWEFGGGGPDVWDCSGLTAEAWQAADVTLPHQSEAQQQTVKNVPLAEAQPGDILWREGYVAIYLGNVGTDRLVVSSRKSEGAVVVHVVDEHDIKAVLRPSS